MSRTIVFLSYSHDSEEYREWVLEAAILAGVELGHTAEGSE
jgi:hypothetical protein